MKLKLIIFSLVYFPAALLAQQKSTEGFSLLGVLGGLQEKIDAAVNGLNPMASGAAIPREIPKEWKANNALAVGTNHVLYLTKTGKVYAWGSNSLGQLGQGKSEGRSATGTEVVSWVKRDFDKPVEVPISGVVAVYAAGHVSFALQADGSVWSWGDAQYTGHGSYREGTPSPIPKKILGLPPIAKIAPWMRGVYAYDAEGKVWAWGNADEVAMLQGFEYQGASSGTPIPSKIGTPADVRPASFGNATYVLTTDGKLMNPSHMKTPMSSLVFEKIYGDSSYTQGALYGKTRDGKIYQWIEGAAEKYSNGTAKHPMTGIEQVGSPVEAARGNGFVGFLQADGSLIVWGGANPGFSGGFVPFINGMKSAVNIPQAVNFPEKIAAIKSHPQGIFLLTDNGVVYKHGAQYGEAVSMKLGTDGRSFTELLRPESLSK